MADEPAVERGIRSSTPGGGPSSLSAPPPLPSVPPAVPAIPAVPLGGLGATAAIPPSVTAAGDCRRRHVSLRFLFLTTAYFAAVSAVAGQLGMGWLLLGGGLYLTWLNGRGYFAPLQSPRGRPRTYRVAWTLFAIALFLPAVSVPGCSNRSQREVLAGWEAAWMTGWTGVGGSIERVGRIPQLESLAQGGELLLELLAGPYYNLPAVAVLLSWWTLRRQQRGEGARLGTLQQLAALSSWTWTLIGLPDLRVGYYVWTASITLLALTAPPRRLAWGLLLAIVLVLLGVSCAQD